MAASRARKSYFDKFIFYYRFKKLSCGYISIDLCTRGKFENIPTYTTDLTSF